MKQLDLDTWNRKEHFEFFSKFDEPFFGTTVEVDCTRCYEKAKKDGVSFFARYQHASMLAVNLVECFRYRILDKKVVVFDVIHASAALARADHTFAFSFVEYTKDFEAFSIKLQQEIDQVKSGTGIRLTDNAKRKDTIHYSVIPWLKFTALSHARHFEHEDSTPKITFGKLHEKEGRKMMPISVHVHHALMDGYHVGQYVDAFQALLNN
jgi:chloramphenicol O-acetyltransferase type A